jgi:hypothetical protein
LALGTPLCADCFDYGGAVVWNHHASDLWRRTSIRVYRELAATLGRSESTVKRQVRLSYVKVAEGQRRGLIHFHAAVRLDAKPTQRQRSGARTTTRRLHARRSGRRDPRRCALRRGAVPI